MDTPEDSGGVKGEVRGVGAGKSGEQKLLIFFYVL